MENNYEYEGSIKLSPEYSNPSFYFYDSETKEPIMVIKKASLYGKGKKLKMYMIYTKYLVNG